MDIKFIKELGEKSRFNGRQLWKWRVIIDGEFRAEIRNLSFGRPRYALFSADGIDLGIPFGTKADLKAFRALIERHADAADLGQAAAVDQRERPAPAVLLMLLFCDPEIAELLMQLAV